MDKTIKQLAEEIGVSKTAINKKIDKLGLRKRLSLVGGQWLIPPTEADTLRTSFLTKQKFRSVTDHQSATVSILEKTVSMLEKELEIKNRQIDELNKRLEESSQSLRALAHVELAGRIEQKDAEEAADPPKKRKWWQFKA